jgi:hypothetical protein
MFCIQISLSDVLLWDLLYPDIYCNVPGLLSPVLSYPEPFEAGYSVAGPFEAGPDEARRFVDLPYSQSLLLVEFTENHDLLWFKQPKQKNLQNNKTRDLS